MAKWYNIQVNTNNIGHDTGKATLIYPPKNGEFGGWCFWHPNKLIRQGSHSHAKSISFTDEFEFKMLKYGKGKYNSRDILEEVIISPDRLMGLFEKMDNANNVTSIDNEESYLVVAEPTKIEEVEIKVNSELLND